MEPDNMPLSPSSIPMINNGVVGEAGSSKDEFGDLSHGLSCLPPDCADSKNSPSSFRQPSSNIKPTTPQRSCYFNPPIKRSQPTCTVNLGSGRGQIDKEWQEYNETSVHMTNGYSNRQHNSGVHREVGVFTQREETGFADFTVFTEQAEHPWCCGFTPLGSEVGGNSSSSLSEQIRDPEQEVIMESELGPHHARKPKERIYTMLNHCEKRDASPVLPAQDKHQPQEMAAGFPPNFGEEEKSKIELRKSCRMHILNPLDKEVQGGEGSDRDDPEKSLSTAPQTFSVYESASEDLASFCEDLSFEGPSADWEPNVSSLSSENQTDWDQTDEEDDDSGNYCNTTPTTTVTQETRATSTQSQSGTHAGHHFADFNDCSLEPQRDQGEVQTAEGEVQSLGTLPPSDSFADFCSAPLQEDGEFLWVEFKDQKAQEEGVRTWTQPREIVNTLHIDGGTEEEDRAEQSGASRRNSCQASLPCRVQQLLLASFPKVEVPVPDGEEEVLSLSALEKMPEHGPSSQCIHQGVWCPHQDLHSAVGLQFRWGGSHANGTLLRSLGVDTKNIVFIGMKKQPVVPAFASSQGMLDPSKNSVCSPKHGATTTHIPLGLQDTPTPSINSMQEMQQSSQQDWNSRGLSSSQDGEDHELYELNISSVETGANGSPNEDPLNRLMSSAEKTSCSFSKPQQDEKLSVEACSVISGLPNLSFMPAKVLMYPSILIVKECCSPQLQ